MAAPFLTQIRIGGEVKQRLREITYDIANEFGVRGAVNPRPVPHITLFGPYNTEKGQEAKRIVKDVLSDNDVVPYRIDGFGCFERNNVIYADIVPSPELREMRRELSKRLRPISFNYPNHDSAYYYDFHITIAYGDVGDRFDDIWNYVTNAYSPRFDEYATRVTSLRRRDMMWEYDLLRGQELSPAEATSPESWERTIEFLSERAAPDDHDGLAPKPSAPFRAVKAVMAKGIRRW